VVTKVWEHVVTDRYKRAAATAGGATLDRGVAYLFALIVAVLASVLIL
jgi:hypothetical protein